MSPLMSRQRYLAAFILLMFAKCACAQVAPPYQSELDTFADRLAPDAQKSPVPPKILVVDFLNQAGNMNVLGQQVADALAHALETRLPAGSLISRQHFHENLISSGLAPPDLRERSTLAANAAQTGANLMITGRILLFKKSSTLQVDISSLPGGQSISSASADLTFAPDDRALLTTLLDWPIPPYALTHCTAKPADSWAVFAAPGVSGPKCLKCNPPPYDEDARRAHWQGRVILNINVNEQGHISVVSIVEGGPFKINEQAIKGVEKWQMQPATLNGKRIKVCTPVEVVFRIHGEPFPSFPAPAAPVDKP